MATLPSSGSPPPGTLYGWNPNSSTFIPLAMDAYGNLGVTFNSGAPVGTPPDDIGAKFGNAPPGTLYGWNSSLQSYLPIITDASGNLLFSAAISDLSQGTVIPTGQMAAVTLAAVAYAALTSNPIDNTAFNILMTNWFNALPTSPTGQAVGSFINSGGTLQQVQP